jgi:hypothetical protein
VTCAHTCRPAPSRAATRRHAPPRTDGRVRGVALAQYHPGSVCMSTGAREAVLAAREQLVRQGGVGGGAASQRKQMEAARARLEELKSIEVIRRTSKPCPSCGAGIMRSEGCNHMQHVPCAQTDTACAPPAHGLRTACTPPAHRRPAHGLHTAACARPAHRLRTAGRCRRLCPHSRAGRDAAATDRRCGVGRAAAADRPRASCARGLRRCKLCSTHFCYNCQQIISEANPYDHFKADGCRIFPDEEVRRQARPHLAPMWREEERALRREAMLGMRGIVGRAGGGLVVRCPFCRLQTLKGADHSNHHRCENCHGAFCFLCLADLRRGIRGHFGRAHPQHGEPPIAPTHDPT